MTTKQINEYLRIVLMNYDATNNDQMSSKNERTIAIYDELEEWKLTCLVNSLEVMFHAVKVTKDNFGVMLHITLRKPA